MINNFLQIRDLLEFDDENDFYYIQIIVRKSKIKDPIESYLKPSSKVIKYYTIGSKIELMELSEEICELCRIFKARAYIHPTRRNFKNISLKMSIQLLKQRDQKEYKTSKKMFQTMCGRFYSTANKRWVVDIDGDFPDSAVINHINHFCRPDLLKVILSIPTPNGRHLITTPFDLTEFKKAFPGIEVHRNNPTVLFSP